MKVAGIIAEFNPFHNGHKYIIDYCKRYLGADYVIVVMSGDFVQRGAPALVSKFSRARMALESDADLVLELPVYYSLGSAEFFAEGAVSVLEGLGVVTDLVFGSEEGDLSKLDEIADILVKEPESYKSALQTALSAGDSFPTARSKAIEAAMAVTFTENKDDNLLAPCSFSVNSYAGLLSSPNAILALEYLKALKRRSLPIVPHAVKRLGAAYGNAAIEASVNGKRDIPTASALGIRNALRSINLSGSAAISAYELKNKSVMTEDLKTALLSSMPRSAYDELVSYNSSFLDCDSFSMQLHHKLALEKTEGFTGYLDVNEELSNRIIISLTEFESFEQFCQVLKTKNLTYTRISRCLMHILLNITEENMSAYKADNYTSYGRILGMKKEASDLLSKIHAYSTIPVPGRLKDFEKELSPLQFKLFCETLTASGIYNFVSGNKIRSEYSQKPLVL